MGTYFIVSQIAIICMAWCPMSSCTVILLSVFDTLWSACQCSAHCIKKQWFSNQSPCHCWHLHTCDEVLHRYVQQLFSFTMNLIIACWWNSMLLTAILSQWTVGTLNVCMQWTCIYIGKDRYYSLVHILCCIVFGTNVCNLTEFMIPNMAHNI
jgi:hypothetical protein